MAKRGRKPGSKNKNGYYFGDREEEAVIQYLKTNDPVEKNKIYDYILKPAFEKMTESIIRRYKLYIPDEDFWETYNDALSFIITKMDKFDPDSGKKAYSYYGTICRNYVTGRIQNYVKTLKRNPSYDDVQEDFGNSIKYSDAASKGNEIASETIEKLVGRIQEMINSPEINDIKPNEVKLGKALIGLFNNWEYVLSTDASNKLNKNAVLLYLRETTGLDTKGIRDNMRKFKKEFLMIKSFVIE